MSYFQNQALQLYGNIPQSYRAINFNDISFVNPNIKVDPDLYDEKGYSADLGMRGNVSDIFNYDISLFTINYDNASVLFKNQTLSHLIFIVTRPMFQNQEISGSNLLQKWNCYIL